MEAAEEMAEVTQSGMTETRREINECSRLLAALGGAERICLQTNVGR